MKSVNEQSTCIYCHGNGERYLHHAAIGKMYQCRSCRLIFGDPVQYAEEATIDLTQISQEPTEAERQQFSKIFSEGIDTSDGEGSMYADFSMSQRDLEIGLADAIEVAAREHASFRFEEPFSVLDIGCATGFLLNELKKRYSHASVTGVEPSPVSCRKGKELYGLELFCGTMKSFNSGEEQFDLVTILGNLHLHENPFETLERAHRVLKPGGLLIFDMKNPLSTVRRLSRVLAQVPVLRSSRLVTLAIERGYLCMRYSGSKKFLSRAASGSGFVPLDVVTRPPRVLAYAKGASNHGAGWVGRLWRLLDDLDGVLDQRAWIQVCCRKPMGVGAA